MTGQVVQVILTGLCTFVSPNIADDHRPLTAVFPNAVHSNPAHHVSLIIAYDDYDVASDLALGPPVYSQTGRPYVVISLDGKTIGVSGLTGSYAPVKKEYCRDPSEPVC